ncbi:MAG TPA: hypothetical protein VES01_06385 [Dermatophilaceae bacterium]|nr:hypothetical protein [Dermatophilaceae bacterium]
MFIGVDPHNQSATIEVVDDRETVLTTGRVGTKISAGKTHAEAIRCLKRRISDAVYRQLVADARVVGAGPGGRCGRL